MVEHIEPYWNTSKERDMNPRANDLERGAAEPIEEEIETPFEEKKKRRPSLDSSDSSSWHSSDYFPSTNNDGHRPCRHELSQSISRSRSRGEHLRALSREQSTACAPGALSSSLSHPISRTLTRRETVLSRIRTRPPVAPFDHPLAHEPTAPSAIVDFDGKNDPYRPINWSTKKKIITTAIYGLCTMSASWASSSYSSGTAQVARHFHVGEQVAVLGTSLFLVGFGLGPLLWAPLSEVYGRKAAVLAPMFIGACFSFGSATAKDLQTLMITRFFGAFFSSAPVTNTGGVLGDL